MTLPLSDQGYEGLLQSAGFGLFRAAIGGELLETNAALARMLGYAGVSELVGVDLRGDVFLDAAEFERLVAGAADREIQEWNETRWKKRDGSPLTVRVVLRVATHPDVGRTVEGVVEDVTERRRQDELVRRNERLASLGTTLAGVAHELNNPLAAVMGFAQLLLKRDLPDEDKNALETISHEAERSAKIVKDLLSLARQREVDRRTPVNVNDVVAYIVRTRRYALETFGITCDLQLDPALPLVCGDRAQLEQVVLNLVSNAEQALRAQLDSRGQPSLGDRPRIRVRTRHDGDMAVLDVEDNGPGIPESQQGRIWDPFYTTRSDGEGTGLGLSLVNHIIAGHGGAVAVESSLPSGAKFTVRLPKLSDVNGVFDGDIPSHAERALDLLIVAADPVDQRFLTRFLTSRGHAVLAASDVDRARRFGAQTTFDAILLDLADGDDVPQVMTELRQMDGCASARFIIMARAAEDAARLSTLIAALDLVLLKPYDVEQLRRAVEIG